MSLLKATKNDKRGLIAESYQIEGLDEAAARSIFLDWAMMDSGENPVESLTELWDRYGKDAPDHPMSKLLFEGLHQIKSKRTGRRPRSN